MRQPITHAESRAGAAVSGAAPGPSSRRHNPLLKPANFTNCLRVAYSFRRCGLVKCAEGETWLHSDSVPSN